QHDVGQHYVVVVGGKQPVAPRDTVAAIDRERLGLEPGGDHGRDRAVVLHQQRAPAHLLAPPYFAIGRWTRKCVHPPASSRSCPMRPSMSRTSLATSARPRPCPFFLLDTNGSKMCSRKAASIPGPLSLTWTSIGSLTGRPSRITLRARPLTNRVRTTTSGFPEP